VVPVEQYDRMFQELKNICAHNNIHIENIPDFTFLLLSSRVPFNVALDQESKGRHAYKLDPSAHLRINLLPAFVRDSLLQHQRDGVRKGLKQFGRVFINDEAHTGKGL